MKLSTLGEFGFIKRISPPFLKSLPKAVVGIGDDCAVIPWKEDSSLLVTTDMLIENVHFLREKISPRDLGYKALAVNLSDIAAMGGKPSSAYLSIGIPSDIDVEWLDKFYAGMYELSESTGTFLLGGDMTRSPEHLVVNLAVIGEVHPMFAKYRSTAEPGDVLGVTGFLGDSGAGLQILREDRLIDEDAVYLVQQHHRPRPHLNEGSWLAHRQGVHAMMDVSDGIDSDLHRIMDASHCGAIVHLESLPLSPQLRRTSSRYGWDVKEIAVAGGEDYCLLATISAEQFPAISREFERMFKRPLVNIGTIADGKNDLTYFDCGREVGLQRRGFDHFSGEGKK